jgi:DNA-binding LytR/AlgR family response regulator
MGRPEGDLRPKAEGTPVTPMGRPEGDLRPKAESTPVNPDDDATNLPPLRVLIADDEDAPREQLASALARAWPAARLVAAAANGVDAWDAWLEHEPEVALLDIRMPGLTGIDVARRIGDRGAVVFVTAYGDHALSAFDAGAVDYVLKPVEAGRLAQALRRAWARLPAAAGRSAAVPTPAADGAPPDAAALQALLAQLAASIRRTPAATTIQAGVGKEVRMIRVEDVVYFESDARYTRVVYRADGQDGEALIRTPLKELLAQLEPQHFWQVHRSVIVAQHHIAAAVRVDEGNMHLTLRGRAEKLPVSRHFQALFKAQ